MKITPLDIRRKEFKRSVRGYSDEEVDIFLDDVADEFERLFQENMELQDRAHRFEEQVAGHAQVKEALEKTLISAQLQAEELKANAQKEGELILRDAESKARGIVSESYSETQRVQQALVQLKLLEEDFRLKFRALLEGYLKLLEEAPIAEVPLDSSTAETPSVAHAAGGSEGLPPVTLEAGAAQVEAPSTSVEPAAAPPAPQAAAAPPTPQAAAASSTPESPPSQDDIPTEETVVAVSGVDAAVDAFAASHSDRPASAQFDAEEVTAETENREDKSADEAPHEEESGQGFFFGRQMGDVDDTFPGEDAVKKSQTRDFEW